MHTEPVHAAHAMATPGEVTLLHTPIPVGDWGRAPVLAQITDRDGIVMTTVHIGI